MNKPELFEETHEATYCPEDDKLRLYVGHVEEDIFRALRKEGWRVTSKQDCDFAAEWTPQREDTALSFARFVGDEDQDPADRAADRAERFGGYRDRRREDAGGYADRYDDQPPAHGYQNAQKAERAADRHNRLADHACDNWRKAEYWQRRTAGVISHALYKERPDVRMRRIKKIETHQRKNETGMREAYDRNEAKRRCLLSVVAHAEGKREKMSSASAAWKWSLSAVLEADGTGDAPPTSDQIRRALVVHAIEDRYGASNYEQQKAIERGELDAVWVAREWLDANNGHAEPEPFALSDSRWHTHYTLRLAYERQMLEADGGRAGEIEMEVGGWVGKHQIHKVNKSRATGRVVSVTVEAPASSYANRSGKPWGPDNPRPMVPTRIKVEDLAPGIYRAPTEADTEALKAAKAAKPKGPKKPSLLNPTPEEAQKLQAVWNKQNARSNKYIYDKEEREPLEMTQAEYSAESRGSYARGAQTEAITGGGFRPSRYYAAINFPTVAKVRAMSGRVVILTDKKQKPLGADVWRDPRPETEAEVLANWDTLTAACSANWKKDQTEEQADIFHKACLVGLAHSSSASQFGLSDRGYEVAKQRWEGVTV